MKKIILSFFLLFQVQAKADLWGADLPLLTQIVFNTLHTMYELQQQSQLLNDQLNGINDRISRIETISDIVQPSKWDSWKDPKTALANLQKIYQTLPKEYKSEKSDLIESEISKAMNLVSKVSLDAKSTFESGKQLESRALSSSPGVSEKLSASGTGTLITQQAQSQILQSHVVSLLTQMVADGYEKESRMVITKGQNFQSAAAALSKKSSSFSDLVFSFGRDQ